MYYGINVTGEIYLNLKEIQLIFENYVKNFLELDINQSKSHQNLPQLTHT